jgi:pyruvate/2-oxoacid:ferredoxin oxidoreductase beta subunit
MARLTIPAEELMNAGHLACPGCAATLAMRYLLKGLGPRTVVTVPACCWAVMSGPFPDSALKVPLLDCAFEATGASVSGIRAGLDALGIEDVTVVGFAGDGGTIDIGLQALSGMLERGTDALYVMYDNEAYMNTGIQRSGATPYGAWTTTTVAGKKERKKDVMDIVLAHDVPYAAAVSIGFPEDFLRKVKKARGIPGPKFLHVFSPCPPGWKYSPERTIELARLATDTKVFPIYEVEGGVWRISRKPPKDRPVEDYLQAQGRFRALSPEDIAIIQADVDARWQDLLARAALGSEGGGGR